LLGLSTSAGNTSINNTTKNSLDILFNVRRSDVIVVRGSEKLIAG
jgi:inosine-uridine nucleoside N-ribohydrolase